MKLDIKSTGATFTPRKLADFLAEKIINEFDFDSTSHELKILDPACGDGELLLSISKKLNTFGISKFKTIGFDSNGKYVAESKKRLDLSSIQNKEIIQADFLQMSTGSDPQLEFNFGKSKTGDLKSFVDIIISNPPYVRTQILGSKKAKLLAKKFKLKGRVDLYYPFLISMTKSLKTGGILGVITSNRFLFTKSGESVRKFLIDNYEIIEVIDLGDTKLFDAAVLPAIFIGRKELKKTNGKLDKTKFLRIYEALNGSNRKQFYIESVFDVLNVTKDGIYNTATEHKKYKRITGIMKYSKKKGETWTMLTNDEAKWTKKIESNSEYTIGDLFKVRVGIKTTADEVFIRKNWDELGNEKPERILLKELISQENIDRWRTHPNCKMKVLYPHDFKDGKKVVININKYPKARKYLEKYQEKLKSRKYLIAAGRNWFEIWVPQNPSYWKKPKLVFPDISSKPRFFLDVCGSIVNGNCYWIVNENNESIDPLLLIQGIANSNLMTKYHDLSFNNKLYSGRRRYFTQYVERYPFPKLDSIESQEIIQIVKELNIDSIDSTSIKVLEEELEIKVANAYGVKPISNPG